SGGARLDFLQPILATHRKQRPSQKNRSNQPARQNCRRRPNCHFLICDRFAIAKICPAVGESTAVAGWPRFTWLNVLNSSARNCPPTRSVIWKRLLSEASVLKKCGPKNELRATFPKLPAAGRLQGPRVHPLKLSSGVAVAVERQP